MRHLDTHTHTYKKYGHTLKHCLHTSFLQFLGFGVCMQAQVLCTDEVDQGVSLHGNW